MADAHDKKKVVAWALYDWANSAFATTVIAGFFPVFFKQYWSAGADPTMSTFKLGMANSAESLIVAIVAPVLGAIADRGGARKRFLMAFASLGILGTGLLYFVSKGDWQLAIALFVMASVGFAGGNIFYDALIVEVAEDKRMDFVSALGFSLGYLGGGLLFGFSVLMTVTPGTFGLEDASQAVRVSFLLVAVWWAIFSIPLFLKVHERQPAHRPGSGSVVVAGLGQVRDTFRKIRKLRMVFMFLFAYWLYIDGVDTVIRMAVDYGMSLGFSSTDLLTALLITQFVGFPSAVAFGKIGERIGAKAGITIGIGVYVGVTVWGFLMKSVFEFYMLAVVIGLVQGGVQSLSRSLYARIIPREQSGEFFGFYNLLGKSAAIIGPAIMGLVGLATGSPRAAILSIAALFLAGGVLLQFVDEKEGKRLARELKLGIEG
jgi:UMF1 family MFS transporter